MFCYNKPFNRTFYSVAFALQILCYTVKTAAPCGFRSPVNFNVIIQKLPIKAIVFLWFCGALNQYYFCIFNWFYVSLKIKGFGIINFILVGLYFCCINFKLRH